MSVARGNRGNRIWNTDPTDLGVRESASVMYTRESMPPRELVFGVTDVTESFSNPDFRGFEATMGHPGPTPFSRTFISGTGACILSQGHAGQYRRRHPPISLTSMRRY